MKKSLSDRENNDDDESDSDNDFLCDFMFMVYCRGLIKLSIILFIMCILQTAS